MILEIFCIHTPKKGIKTQFAGVIDQNACYPYLSHDALIDCAHFFNHACYDSHLVYRRSFTPSW